MTGPCHDACSYTHALDHTSNNQTTRSTMSSTPAHQSEDYDTAALCHDYSPEDNVRKWLAANLNEDFETEGTTRSASCNSLFVNAFSNLRFLRRTPQSQVLSVRSLGSLSQGNETSVPTICIKCAYNEDQEL